MGRYEEVEYTIEHQIKQPGSSKEDTNRCLEAGNEWQLQENF